VLRAGDTEPQAKRPTLNLCAVDLRGVNLRGAKFRKVLLNNSNLAAAHLEDADFRGRGSSTRTSREPG